LISVWTLDLIGILASFTFLGFSSWRDIVSREVTDRLWVVCYPIGLLLLVLRLVAQTGSWLLLLFSVASALILSIALPHLGLWGGADGKAFLCLAIMNPVTPVLGAFVLPIVNPFFPLVVFSNAYVASLASILYPIQRNLRTHASHELFEGLDEEGRFRKVAAFLTGYRVAVEELESNHFLFPLESVRRQGSALERHFKFEMRVDSDLQKEVAEIRAAADSRLLRGPVWVSPGLPFLVFVTVGLGLSLLLGDIVWYIVSSLLNSLAMLV